MLMRIVVLTVILVMVGGMVCASEVSEGQVVSVSNRILTVRVASGEAMAFSPTWTKERGSWVPTRPARTILPALEAGETVRVTWTMDAKESRRRIDTIEVTSPIQRNSRGTVVSRSRSELVIRPLEKPGTVTMNTKMVQVEDKCVPDPEISRMIQSLKAGDKATINWAWDKEGRKRILGVFDVEAAPINKDPK